jgi:hypothetical protein
MPKAPVHPNKAVDCRECGLVLLSAAETPLKREWPREMDRPGFVRPLRRPTRLIQA